MHLAGLSRRTVAQVVAGGVLTLAVGIVSTGTATAATPRVTANSAAPAIGIIPESANGCSGAICIFVTGSGLQVSDWTTTVVLSRSMCSTASFWANGVLVARGGSQCGASGDELLSDWPNPGNFANGTVLCNTWSGISGKPCETVHS
jgi:hypothetical protein